MKHNPIQIAFFATLFVVVAGLALMIFAPFLQALVLAGVAAIALQPLYRAFLRITRNRQGIAAVLTLAMSLVLVGIPISLISTQVFNESQDMYLAISRDGGAFVERVTEAIENPIRRYAPYFDINANSYVADVFGWISRNVGGFITGTIQIVLGTLLTVVIAFFFLRDGKALVATISDASPMDDKYDVLVMSKIRDTINAIVRGLIFIGVIQGVLVGLGLWVFGVPNATLWGTFAALAAMIPGLGTGLVNGPAIIYVLSTGNVAAGIGLAVWSALIVGMIDNVLAPMFYSKGVKVHPMVVLLSVLGGLATFGLLGFIYGPVIVSVFVAMMTVYKEQTRSNA
jgi:predicted PurR-regulated permease PerM